MESGQRVRLDGSRSTGQIRSYTWTLVGEACAAYPPHRVSEKPSQLAEERSRRRGAGALPDGGFKNDPKVTAILGKKGCAKAGVIMSPKSA